MILLSCKKRLVARRSEGASLNKKVYARLEDQIVQPPTVHTTMNMADLYANVSHSLRVDVSGLPLHTTIFTAIDSRYSLSRSVSSHSSCFVVVSLE